MSYNPEIHHRRSIRLKGYDYSSSGMYFITLCTKNMKSLFGHVLKEKMILNDAGIIAQLCWQEIPEHFTFVDIDEFVIMPNHVHGIIVIRESDDSIRDDAGTNINSYQSLAGKENLIYDKRPRGTSKSIGSIVRGYKIGVTKWFRINLNDQQIWQRDYYEHIIRNDLELKRIRNYIIANPKKWRNR